MKSRDGGHFKSRGTVCAPRGLVARRAVPYESSPDQCAEFMVQTRQLRKRTGELSLNMRNCFHLARPFRHLHFATVQQTRRHHTSSPPALVLAAEISPCLLEKDCLSLSFSGQAKFLISGECLDFLISPRRGDFLISPHLGDFLVSPRLGDFLISGKGLPERGIDFVRATSGAWRVRR